MADIWWMELKWFGSAAAAVADPNTKRAKRWRRDVSSRMIFSSLAAPKKGEHLQRWLCTTSTSGGGAGGAGGGGGGAVNWFRNRRNLLEVLRFLFDGPKGSHKNPAKKSIHISIDIPSIETPPMLIHRLGLMDDISTVDSFHCNRFADFDCCHQLESIRNASQPSKAHVTLMEPRGIFRQLWNDYQSALCVRSFKKKKIK